MAAHSTAYSRAPLLWSAWVVAALLLLPFAGDWTYLALVGASALVLCAVPGALPHDSPRTDRQDLLAIALTYLGVVALLRLAFVGFTTDHVTGLFLSFAAALLLGVAGPVVYTVWLRERPMSSLGLRRDNLRPTLALALLFGGMQFGLTLWGYDLPAAEDWVPLLGMSLVVGVFEAVFFRGFVQTLLERQFGRVIGIAGAALLYGGYHVGYGMGADELAFLTGLGVVYAVAFAIARNVLVLWPLLTPLGSFYANVDAGDIDLPWASLAGFADVLAVMVLVGLLAFRHERRRNAAREGAVGQMSSRSSRSI